MALITQLREEITRLDQELAGKSRYADEITLRIGRELAGSKWTKESIDDGIDVVLMTNPRNFRSYERWQEVVNARLQEINVKKKIALTQSRLNASIKTLREDIKRSITTTHDEIQHFALLDNEAAHQKDEEKRKAAEALKAKVYALIHQNNTSVLDGVTLTNTTLTGMAVAARGGGGGVAISTEAISGAVAALTEGAAIVGGIATGAAIVGAAIAAGYAVYSNIDHIKNSLLFTKQTPVNTLVSASLLASALKNVSVAELRRIAQAGGTVELPIGGVITSYKEDTQLQLIRTPAPIPVKVIEAQKHPELALYGATLKTGRLIPEQQIWVSPLPISQPDPSNKPIPTPEIPKLPTHTGHDTTAVQSSIAYVNPIPEDIGLRMVIMTFPDHTQLPPIVTMFRDPRDVPGVVTGNGQDISDTTDWLVAAGSEQGAHIPREVAAGLNGREFNSFDELRQAFWLEIAKHERLLKQFSERNAAVILKGRAPSCIKKEQRGRRQRFELHHIRYISKGGAVYDLDNLVVMTPNQHINKHLKG